MILINLTQHNLTQEQLKDAVEVGTDVRDEIIKLITFNGLPTAGEIKNNASRLAEICRDMHASHAVIGGAPYFMRPLEQALRRVGVTPLYAFTERVAVEVTNPETGEVTKTSKFNFAGWIEGVL